MNCPSRTDETLESRGWNQSPPELSANLTTREDLNGKVNTRAKRDSDFSDHACGDGVEDEIDERHAKDRPACSIRPSNADSRDSLALDGARSINRGSVVSDRPPGIPVRSLRSNAISAFQATWRTIAKFGTFIGPGFMVSVAYIDPGNYSTDVAAGASTKFRLLFIVLMSNIFAILLQSLAVRLGTVTGLNLAEHCRAHLPRWLNFILYILGEAAIIATDIAEVTIA